MDGDLTPNETTAAPDAPVEAPSAATSSPPAPDPTEGRPDFAAGFREMLAARGEPTTESVEPDPATAEATPPAADPPPTPEPKTAEAAAAATPAPTQPDPATIPADVLQAAVEAHLKRIDDERETKRKADEAAAKANEAAERLIGKPGELADLLQRRAAAIRSADWSAFSQVDEDRLTALTEGAQVYQPLLARAREEAAAESSRSITEAQQQNAALLQGWAGQFQQAAALNLPGIDGQALLAAEGIPAVVSLSHKAGADSRQPEIDKQAGEIEHLKSQLAEARGQVFGSQPRLETAGGQSATGRGRPGLAPDASPREELAAGFAAQHPGANGRR